MIPSIFFIILGEKTVDSILATTQASWTPRINDKNDLYYQAGSLLNDLMNKANLLNPTHIKSLKEHISFLISKQILTEEHLIQFENWVTEHSSKIQ